MSDKVLQNLKDYIKKECCGKIKKIFLQWYGGEPLLKFNIIKDLTAHIESLNIPFNADIVTNGVLLTEEKINLLKKLKINSIQITLDGIKETHDKKRRFKNSKGSYDVIMNNLLILHSYVEKNKDIQVNIRINIDKDNKNEYHIVYSHIRKNFPLFYPYLGILTKYQTCSSNINCFSGKEEIAEYLFEQYEKYKINSIPYRSIIKGISPCMAECINTDMVGPKGELYLCLKDVGDKKEVIGSITTGKTNSTLISEYCVGNISHDNNKCFKCKIFWLCGGGCPNHKYRNKKYGELHDICSPIKNTEILKKFLDLRYDIRKIKTEENE
jgi:uncharacterized protein